MFKNKYTAIVCVNNNNAISKNGELIYSIGADMKNFKSLTTDNVVIMGRKTFESLPNKQPLKNRINIVLTSDENYYVESDSPELYDNTYVCNTLEEVDDLCYAYFSDRELFIIGGGLVYEEAYELGIIDKAIVTVVNDGADGDTFFPNLENDENYKVIFRTMSLRDQANDLYYRYVVYKRKC